MALTTMPGTTAGQSGILGVAATAYHARDRRCEPTVDAARRSIVISIQTENTTETPRSAFVRGRDV